MDNRYIDRTMIPLKRSELKVTSWNGITMEKKEEYSKNFLHYGVLSCLVLCN